MTINQRILALDAAACACEGIGQEPKYKNLQSLLNWLQDELDQILNSEYENVTFEDFLKQQAEAVEALGKCPEVWGGGEDEGS